MTGTRYPQDRLARTAAVSTSLVDLLRRLGAPLGSHTLRYVSGRLERYGIDTLHFVHEPLPSREKRSYTRELLQEAAAHSYSVREMFEYLGYPPDNSPYGHVRKKLDQFGIDTSHFTSGRRYSRGFVPAETLTPAVARSSSLAGLLNLLGLVDNGASRERVKRSAERYGISIDHFTGQGHRRGLSSPMRKSAEQILRPKATGSQRTKTTLLRRALDDLGVPHNCAECGIGDSWRGKRLVLEIDHVNGDRLDNRRENLRYLCPSCHSQTRTYSRSRRTRDQRRPVK
ncbi:HNH endonuclease signature motif containing protein [Streptomyces sp. NPDC006446]|uniref:HNH endonuclease signature motif containing protein n=1 Tax=Streptomyces sp. NPDC006446 TaxID=3154301 RepID=UPI0033A8B271